MSAQKAVCQLCGEPMPAGEEMFNYHGYSGPCPKPPKSGQINDPYEGPLDPAPSAPMSEQVVRRVTDEMVLAALREDAAQKGESFDAMWRQMDNAQRDTLLDEWRCVIECALSAAPAVPVNQCDGCRRGLPLVEGIHKGEGYDFIACTADRYAPAVRREDVELLLRRYTVAVEVQAKLGYWRAEVDELSAALLALYAPPAGEPTPAAGPEGGEDARRLDWLEGELDREQEAIRAGGRLFRLSPKSLFRQNVPITRAAIDAAMSAALPAPRPREEGSNG